MACSSCNGGCTDCGCDPVSTNWEIPVGVLPSLEMASRKNAYVLPDGTVWALNYDGDAYVQLGGDGEASDPLTDAEEALPDVSEAIKWKLYRQGDHVYMLNEAGDDYIDLACCGSVTPAQENIGAGHFLISSGTATSVDMIFDDTAQSLGSNQMMGVTHQVFAACAAQTIPPEILPYAYGTTELYFLIYGYLHGTLNGLSDDIYYLRFKRRFSPELPDLAYWLEIVQTSDGCYTFEFNESIDS